MRWRVEIRTEVELDVAEAASWYARREPGLGGVVGPPWRSGE